MSLERKLQFSMTALACLGGLALGTAQGETILPVLVVIVAASSLYFTDIRGWIKLPTSWTNLAGVAATVYSLWGIPLNRRDVLFLSLARLLVYLQFILLYREKTARIYWMIAMLSLLQMAVASVLSISFYFGLLLILFLFAALTALSLFLLYREHVRDRGSADGAPASADGKVGWLELLFETPAHRLPQTIARRFRTTPPAPAESPAPRRWPLPIGAAEFHPRLQKDGAERGTTKGLARFVLRTALVTLLITPVIFVSVPRMAGGGSGWNPGSHAVNSIVGFSEDVTLGEMGSAVESPESVMTVKFVRRDTGREYQLLEPPLLRGTALTHYADGSWQRDHGRVEPLAHRPYPRNGSAEKGDAVLQMITLEPTANTNVLFGVAPSYASRDREVQPWRVEWDIKTDELIRPENMRGKAISYRLLTYAFRNGRFSPLRRDDVRRVIADSHSQFLAPFHVPEPRPGPRPSNVELWRRQRARLRGLKLLSDRIVGALPAEARANREAVALALDSHLRDSGQYAYTLDPVDRDANLDPIEDFLMNVKAGHCEYFASALTLMLRSQGIPARMVVGFKGGEWNEVGRFYQIRQMHAHTWVEALIEDTSQPPAPLFGGRSSWSRRGRWLTLDPTASVQTEEVNGWSPQQWLDFAQYTWFRYTLGMNPKRQRESIFAPLARAVSTLFDRNAWREWYRDFQALISGEELSWRRWINWRAGVVAFIAQLLLVILFRLTLRLVRRWRRPAKTPAAVARHFVEVPFYQRLERLLAARGLNRPVTQTHYDFAVAAGAMLADDPATRGAAFAPRRVVQAFYQVRFGRQPLDTQDTQAVEQALDSLEAALKPTPPDHRTS